MALRISWAFKQLIKLCTITVILFSSFTAWASADTYYISQHEDLKSRITTIIENHNLYHPDDELVISLGAGEHSLSNCAKFCVEIKNSKNITLIGEHNPLIKVSDMQSSTKGIFSINSSSNIRFENFKLDYAFKPYLQGEITWIGDPSVAVQKGKFSMRLIGGKQIDVKTINTAKNSFGVVYDRNQFGVRKEDTNVHLAGENKPNISYNPNNNRYYFNFSVVSNHLANMVHRDLAVGDNFVYVGRFDYGAINISKTKDIIIKKITIHSSPSGAIIGEENSGTQIYKNNKIMPKVENIVSSNGDGIHFQSSYGPIEVIDNYIKGTADDGLAIYNKGMMMKSQSGSINPYSFSVNKGKYPVPLSRVKVGHTLQFVDIKSNTLLLNSRVEAISRHQDLDYIRVKSNLFDKISEGDHEISVYNLSMAGSHSVIKNNVFDSVRRGGINLKSRFATVQGNTFYNVDKWAIAAHIEKSYPSSGPLPFGHTISDNRFQGYSHRATGVDNSNIRIGSFLASNPNSGSIAANSQMQILIENNYHQNSAIVPTLISAYGRR